MPNVVGTAGAGGTPGRNEPCPCGSGLKLKRCHALNPPPAGVPVLGDFGTVPRAGAWHAGATAAGLMTYLDAGAGDAIHAMRHVRPGRRYVVRPSMERLFSMSFPAASAWSRHPLPPVDSSMGSLDLIRINPGGALRAPYLVAPDPVAQDHRFHVGLCLRGDPTQRWDRWRSVTDVAPIVASLVPTPGVVWHALERADLPAGADWADTADLVAGLDAVVSVDTGVAHLAGALGVPLVLLDRATHKPCGCGSPIHAAWCAAADPGPDERWDEGFLQRGPLYAGGVWRVRQRRRGDWSDVAGRAADVLRALRATLRPTRRASAADPSGWAIRFD